MVSVGADSLHGKQGCREPLQVIRISPAQTSPDRCLSKELLSLQRQRLCIFLWEFISLKEFNLTTNGIVLRCISSQMLVLWAGDKNRSSPSCSQQHCVYLYTSTSALCSEVIQSILKSIYFRKLWGTRRKIKLCFSFSSQGCNWLAVKILWHKSGELQLCNDNPRRFLNLLLFSKLSEQQK